MSVTQVLGFAILLFVVGFIGIAVAITIIDALVGLVSWVRGE